MSNQENNNNAATDDFQPKIAVCPPYIPPVELTYEKPKIEICYATPQISNCGPCRVAPPEVVKCEPCWVAPPQVRKCEPCIAPPQMTVFAPEPVILPSQPDESNKN